MPDAWDQFPDAQASGADQWAKFPDAQQEAPQHNYFARTLGNIGDAGKEYISKMSSDVGDAVTKYGKALSFNPIKNAAGVGEAALNVGTGMLSAPLALAAKMSGNTRPTADIRADLTYQPRTEMGQAIPAVIGSTTQPVSDALSLGAKGMSAVTPMNQDTSQAIIDTALLGTGARATAKTFKPLSSVEATAKARQYVGNNTNLDWNSLSDKTRQTLTSIAQDSKNFDGLDPQAIERQARLDSLGVPATRGQVTRDLAQLTREENITKSDAGQPVRDVTAAQDTRLHQLVDTLRTSTGAKAETRQATGGSVQGAARAEESASHANYDALFKKARATEPTATVSAAPMAELLKNNPEIQHLGFLKSWLDKAKLATTTPEVAPSSVLDASGKPMIEGTPAKTETRGVNLVELDDLRRKAGGIMKGGGDNAYYAGEVVKAIDQSFDDIPAAAKAWTEARSAFKAHKMQFEDQAAVDKLVGNKSRTDRNTALEDTFDQVVLRGSTEDIGKVKKLLVSGSTKDKVQGAQAWKDIQGATLDYLKEKAAGKRAIVGEKNQLQFNSTFRDAFNELEKDGKIGAVFSPAQANMLRQINDAVGDVRTKPAGRIAGSDTTPRILAMLEKVSKLPLIGNITSGTVKFGMKLNELGKEGKEISRATTTPLDEAASDSVNALKKKESKNKFRRISGAAAASDGSKK